MSDSTTHHDTLPSGPGPCPKRSNGRPCGRNLAELQCAYCGRPMRISEPYAWSSRDAGVSATDILQWLAAAREQAPHCRPDSPEAEDQRRIALLCNALMWARAPQQAEPGERVQPSMTIDYLRVTDPVLQALSRQNEAQAQLIAELQETAERITRCWHCHDALIPPEPKHCERCPSFGDCHVRNCPEPGCDEKSPWGDDD